MLLESLASLTSLATAPPTCRLPARGASLLLRVDLEEPGDEVLGRAGDGVEELRIELVVGGGDLPPGQASLLFLFIWVI